MKYLFFSMLTLLQAVASAESSSVVADEASATKVIAHCFYKGSPPDHLKLEMTLTQNTNAAKTVYQMQDQFFGMTRDLYRFYSDHDAILTAFFLPRTENTGEENEPFPSEVDLNIDLKKGPVMGSLYEGQRIVHYYPSIKSDQIEMLCSVSN